MGIIEELGGLVNDGVAAGKDVANRTVLDGRGDRDQDGLTNDDELRLGTDPNHWDTDRDGLADGSDPSRHSADGDGDGVSDPDELALGTNPTNPDTDVDGLDDGLEAGFGADPLDADTDDDGVTDGWEVVWRGTDPTAFDTDGDGLGDGREVELGTRGDLADTDGDGLGDGIEVANGFDPLDTDTFDNGWGDQATYDFQQSVVEVPTEGGFAAYQADGPAQVLEPRDDIAAPPSGGGGADDDFVAAPPLDAVPADAADAPVVAEDPLVYEAPVAAFDPADPTVPDLVDADASTGALAEPVPDDAVDPGFGLVGADALDDDFTVTA